LVTKYTKDIKKVSPHKLRATYGTNLYIATKDIYLVSDTLGHRNVETTRRHYADIPSERKKEARNYIHLRKLPVRH
jgi:integrase/recombinase XerC